MYLHASRGYLCEDFKIIPFWKLTFFITMEN